MAGPRIPVFGNRAGGALVCDVCGCVVSPIKADQDRHTAWHQSHEEDMWPPVEQIPAP